MTAEGDKRVLLQVRVSEEVVKAVDRVSVEKDEWRAQTVERLLRLALDTYKKEGTNWPYGIP